MAADVLRQVILFDRKFEVRADALGCLQWWYNRPERRRTEPDGKHETAPHQSGSGGAGSAAPQRDIQLRKVA